MCMIMVMEPIAELEDHVVEDSLVGGYPEFGGGGGSPSEQTSTAKKQEIIMASTASVMMNGGDHRVSGGGDTGKMDTGIKNSGSGVGAGVGGGGGRSSALLRTVDEEDDLSQPIDDDLNSQFRSRSYTWPQRSLTASSNVNEDNVVNGDDGLPPIVMVDQIDDDIKIIEYNHHHSPYHQTTTTTATNPFPSPVTVPQHPGGYQQHLPISSSSSSSQLYNHHQHHLLHQQHHHQPSPHLSTNNNNNNANFSSSSSNTTNQRLSQDSTSTNGQQQLQQQQQQQPPSYYRTGTVPYHSSLTDINGHGIGQATDLNGGGGGGGYGLIQQHHQQQQQQQLHRSGSVSEPITGNQLAASLKKNTSRRNAWGNMSYADLITQAINGAPERRLTLSQIYEWMVQNVTYFKDKGDSNSSAGWKNSIRHNLSLHNRFMRVQNEGTGKSSWWVINPDAKPGKAARRRAISMETPKYEKRRGRVKKHVEQLRAAGLVSAAAAAAAAAAAGGTTGTGGSTNNSQSASTENISLETLNEYPMKSPPPPDGPTVARSKILGSINSNNNTGNNGASLSSSLSLSDAMDRYGNAGNHLLLTSPSSTESFDLFSDSSSLANHHLINSHHQQYSPQEFRPRASSNASSTCSNLLIDANDNHQVPLSQLNWSTADIRLYGTGNGGGGYNGAGTPTGGGGGNNNNNLEPFNMDSPSLQLIECLANLDPNGTDDSPGPTPVCYPMLVDDPTTGDVNGTGNNANNTNNNTTTTTSSTTNNNNNSNGNDNDIILLGSSSSSSSSSSSGTATNSSSQQQQSGTTTTNNNLYDLYTTTNANTNKSPSSTTNDNNNKSSSSASSSVPSKNDCPNINGNVFFKISITGNSTVTKHQNGEEQNNEHYDLYDQSTGGTDFVGGSGSSDLFCTPDNGTGCYSVDYEQHQQQQNSYYLPSSYQTTTATTTTGGTELGFQPLPPLTGGNDLGDLGEFGEQASLEQVIRNDFIEYSGPNNNNNSNSIDPNETSQTSSSKSSSSASSNYYQSPSNSNNYITLQSNHHQNYYQQQHHQHHHQQQQQQQQRNNIFIGENNISPYYQSLTNAATISMSGTGGSMDTTIGGGSTIGNQTVVGGGTNTPTATNNNSAATVVRSWVH